MVAKNVAVSVEASSRTEVFYPETDGMPLPDGFYQSEHFHNLLMMLKVFFRLREDVVVGGDVFIYYVEGDPRVTVAPDCFVVIGVSEESFLRNNTYIMWEVGKAPDFVLEIGSPSTWRQDLGPKRDLYASLGVGEYWMFDPSGGDHYGFALRGETLVDGEYRLLDSRSPFSRGQASREDGEVGGNEGGDSGYSPALNLEFHWVEGSLRLYDPVGERWLQTATELEESLASAESERAIAESRVETERIARESAEARLAEMEAELRRIRGD